MRGELLRLLGSAWSGRTVEVHTSLTSTNDRAAEILRESGAGADRAVVIADEQTAGRGRQGRVWSTAPGRSLALTMVLAPSCDDPQVQLIPLSGAISVVKVLLSESGLEARVKWPNDVLCSGRKLAGVLAESRWCGDRLEGVVLGVGVNLGQRDEDFPPDVRGLATSVYLEGGGEPDRTRFAAALIREVDLMASMSIKDPAGLIEEASRLWFHGAGDTVAIDAGGREVEGGFHGIGPGGELLLEVAGRVSPFLSGDVTRVVRSVDRARVFTPGGRCDRA